MLGNDGRYAAQRMFDAMRNIQESDPARKEEINRNFICRVVSSRSRSAKLHGFISERKAGESLVIGLIKLEL